MRNILCKVVAGLVLAGIMMPVVAEAPRVATGEFIPIEWKDAMGKVQANVYVVELKLDNGVTCYFLTGARRPASLALPGSISEMSCK